MTGKGGATGGSVRWVGLLLGAVEPVDDFAHALADALVAAAVGADQDGDKEDGEADFNHGGAAFRLARAAHPRLRYIVAAKERYVADPRSGAPERRAPVVAALTLGCKLNQAETEAAARALRGAGCVTVDRPAEADAWLINTCSVTHTADRKARRLIRLARRLTPNAPVVVTGCYTEHAGGALAVELGVAAVVPNAEKARAAEAVLRALGRSGNTGWSSGTGRAGGRTRAFVKIQEGCDDVCAFCIVPSVRGRERAVPIAEVAAEVRERVAEGVQEVVLTGTQPGAYGRDRGDGTNAARLLETLLSETDAPRLRYSSIQPQDITPELLACWDDARLCRHFHLALQSGSDAVLGRMRRRYSAAQFLEALERIRLAAPGAAITTDVIVGFPGETEEDFERTYALCREAAFADMHVFPYSPRPRTGAALLEDDVAPPVKRERARRLRELAVEQATRFRGQLAGETLPVLFESFDGARLHGLTDTYAPVLVDWPVDGLADRLVDGEGEAPPLNWLTAVEIVGLASDGEGAPAALGKLAGR